MGMHLLADFADKYFAAYRMRHNTILSEGQSRISSF
jgi:hypothetical protein